MYRSAGWHELGVHRQLLPGPQPGRARATRRPALGAGTAEQRRLRRIERLQHAGDWPATARLLAAEARAVQAGGADFLLIGTNTMHRVAPEIEAAIDIPRSTSPMPRRAACWPTG